MGSEPIDDSKYYCMDMKLYENEGCPEPQMGSTGSSCRLGSTREICSWESLYGSYSYYTIRNYTPYDNWSSCWSICSG